MALFPSPGVVLVALLVQLSFSGWHVLGGVALSGSHAVNPLVFALYRETAASVLMGVAAAVLEGPEALWMPLTVILRSRTKNQDIGTIDVLSYSDSDVSLFIHEKKGSRTFLLFFFAGFASFCNVVGSVVALRLLSSDVYSMYQPTIPVFTTALALLFGYERPNAYIFAGIFLSVLGAFLVQYFAERTEDDTRNTSLGHLLVLGQCIGGGALLALMKPLTQDYSVLVVTAGYYTTGSVFTAIACLCAQLPLAAFYWPATIPWAALLYAVLVSTFFAYEAYSWLVKQASPTFVAAFCSTQPLFTILLNFIIFNEGLSASAALGGLVVVVGLGLTIRGKDIQLHKHQTDDSQDYLPLEEGDNDDFQHKHLLQDDDDDDDDDNLSKKSSRPSSQANGAAGGAGGFL